MEIKKKDSKIFFDFLKYQDQLLFFQVYKPTIKGARQRGALNGSGSYHQNFESLEKELNKYNGKGLLCLGLQPRKKETSKIDGIDVLQIIVLDIDVRAKRKVDYVSTTEDHEHSIKKAYETKDLLKDKFNLDTGLIINSGNGAQVLVKIEVSTESVNSIDEWHLSEDYKRLVKIEKHISNEISDKVVEVDSITKDLARRLKIPGTINKKDTHQAEDRYSRILFQSKENFVKSNTMNFLKIEVSRKNLKNKEAESKDNTRSAKEFAILINLIKNGISEEKILRIMDTTCEKWKESPESYRKHQYKNAFEIVKSKDVRLPDSGYPFILFAKQLSLLTQKHNGIYYRPQANSFVEITIIRDKLNQQKNIKFNQVSPARLINILEKDIHFYSPGRIGDKIRRSPSEQNMKILFENDNFRNSLNQIDRILSWGMPFLSDGKLLLPKKCYDESLNSYLLPNGPNIKRIDLEESKKIIYEIFKEFCFKEEQDRVMAISALITPACRGLYERITARTPLFFYLANRERCGKDYCAGITGILYEGISLDDPPISTSDRFSNSSEELRKKITSGIREGRRRFHFANNKGHLDNAMLEQFITSEHWKDRLLGKNKEIQLNNETDVSLSANIGITYTPDIAKRSRFINLFFGLENINSRKFEKPDLHGWILENRGEILSAIYTLILTWYEAGMPEGKTLFSSFPEWAKIVGGIMSYHGLGDPCLEENTDFLYGDVETGDFKKLWELMYEFQEERPFLVKEMMDKIDNWKMEGIDIFGEYDLNNKSGRTSFGKKIQKYINREFGGITFLIHSKSDRTNTQTYVLKKL